MNHSNESTGNIASQRRNPLTEAVEDAPLIRLANDRDAAAILEIYAPFIIDSSVTFETAVPSVEEFTARVAGIRATCPYLVIERDGKVCGYAYAHPSADRAAYAWNAELSVYLSPAERKHGCAYVLCEAIEELLCAQGYKNLLSRVTSPNAGSEKLHAKLGFNVMGVQVNAGYKAGRWHDVQHFQKNIAPCTSDPCAVKSFGEIDSSLVADVVARANARLAKAWRR